MNESQISVRYAKALFYSASDQKLLEDISSEMEVLTNICKLEEFQYMLIIPTLQPGQKIKLMESIFEKHFSKLSLAMIKLVIENKRESYLPAIARNYGALYRKAKGIRTAKLITAQPVDESAMDKIRHLIRKAYDSEVDLSSTVDGNLIGGFILTIEDMQYDASVSSNLRKLKKQLLQTSIEK